MCLEVSHNLESNTLQQHRHEVKVEGEEREKKKKKLVTHHKRTTHQPARLFAPSLDRTSIPPGYQGGVWNDTRGGDLGYDPGLLVGAALIPYGPFVASRPSGGDFHQGVVEHAMLSPWYGNLPRQLPRLCSRFAI